MQAAGPTPFLSPLPPEEPVHRTGHGNDACPAAPVPSPCSQPQMQPPAGWVPVSMPRAHQASSAQPRDTACCAPTAQQGSKPFMHPCHGIPGAGVGSGGEGAPGVASWLCIRRQQDTCTRPWTREGLFGPRMVGACPPLPHLEPAGKGAAIGRGCLLGSRGRLLGARWAHCWACTNKASVSCFPTPPYPRLPPALQ